jgi:hypothetical protein
VYELEAVVAVVETDQGTWLTRLWTCSTSLRSVLPPCTSISTEGLQDMLDWAGKGLNQLNKAGHSAVGLHCLFPNTHAQAATLKE